MAASLRFAARKLCGRALERLQQPYFTAAVKDEQRGLFPRISHGGSFPGRFTSSESQNLVNKQHGAQSAANIGESSSEHIPWFVLSHPNYVRNIFFGTIGTAIGGLAIFYLVDYKNGGPFSRRKSLDLPPK